MMGICVAVVVGCSNWFLDGKNIDLIEVTALEGINELLIITLVHGEETCKLV